MSGRSDFELLRQYLDTGSQEAFAELVARHVNLVYTAANRQVRDRHAADDVAQAAFVVLARKAGSLRPGTLVSAWLLGVTRMVARNWMKSEGRRRRREEAAARERTTEMARGTDTAATFAAGDNPGGPAHGAPSADALDGHLDDAMAKLSGGAREALVLRFFQGQSFREVGDELGISEEAAKQRVFRGLERLRESLGSRGVQVSPAALAVTLTATAVLPAPAGLAPTLATAATAAGSAAQYALLIKGAASTLAWTKAATTTVLVAGSVLLIGGAGVLLIQSTGSGGGDGSMVMNVASSAGSGSGSTFAAPMPTRSGWPAPPPPIPAAAAYQGAPISGTVVTSEGSPAAGVEVLAVTAFEPAGLYEAATPDDNQRFATTDANGAFDLRPKAKAMAVVARSDAGYAVVPIPPHPAAGAKSAPLRVPLQPWARIEGTVRAAGKPAAGARLEAMPPLPEPSDATPLTRRAIAVYVDGDGKFVLDRVVPGETWITWQDGNDTNAPTRSQRCVARAGETTTVALGGTGRAVTGRVVGAPMPDDGVGRISPAPSDSPVDANSTANTTTLPADAVLATIHFKVPEDGAFRIEAVPPGEYELTLDAPAGTATALFAVRATDGTDRDTPVDVGPLSLAPRGPLKPGSPVPPMTGTSLSGRPAALEDFRGKYVLLNPWRSTDAFALQEVEWLKAIRDRFADHADVEIVGIGLQESPQAARDTVRQTGMSWPQVLDVKLAQKGLGQLIPLTLIGPDGNFIALGLDGPQAYDALDKAVARPAPDARVRVERVANAAPAAPPTTAESAEGPASSSGSASAPASAPSVTPAPATAQTPAKFALAADDAATTAKFTLIAGRRDRVGGEEFLHDGKFPPTEDSPFQNFFLQPATLTGRLKTDLGRPMDVASIVTYSWHKDARAPQVYRVYGSDGTAANFDPAPPTGTDPAARGWKRLAAVDTRPPSGAAPGGRYAVRVSDTSGSLGTYRYLLFEMFATEARDPWGHTFYGEIDVVENK